MRTWLGMLVVVGALVGGCGMQDKHRAYFHDEESSRPEFAATHLGQNFDERSVTDFLSPEERQALAMTDWGPRGAFDTGRVSGEPPPPDADQSTGDKIAGTTMTLLGLGITLGAMVAPYLLY